MYFKVYFLVLIGSNMSSIEFNNRFWCSVLGKPKCHEEKHKMTDFGKDVKEFDGWIVEMETNAKQTPTKALRNWERDRDISKKKRSNWRTRS